MRPARSLAILGVMLVLAIGTVAASAEAATSISVDPHEIQPAFEKEVNRDIPNSQSNAHVPASHVPRPATVGVTGPTAAMGTNFAGLNHFDQRNGADNGNQFSLEPPDQGLCVGNGVVIEAVNDVFATYDAAGTKTSATTSLTRFFTGESQIVRNGPLAFGDFLSDPKCYFDPALGRFFLTVLEIDQNAATGAFEPHTSTLIAVSKGSAPSTSPRDWHFYAFDTTNAGGAAVDTQDGKAVRGRTLPVHPGCPCLGDQPLIGADAFGFYVTTNEFSLFGPGFNGAQVYALDKAALTRGKLRLQYVAGEAGLLPLAEGPAYSLQPATSPAAADWETADGGTEYLLSALDFDGTLDNRIAVWALTNTASLQTASPAVRISSAVLPSEVYGQPPDAVQKDGPTPFASVVQQLFGAKNSTSSSAPQEELLAGNDDRMNQAVFAGGRLWGALNTVVKPPEGPTNVGSAYFVVSPSVAGGQVAGTVTAQGYVAVAGQNLLFPSIAVTTGGTAVYTASLAGPDFFPSSVYATIDPQAGPSDVHVAGAGLGPEDGFTGYPPFGGPTARWGDYSAAVPDASGSVWLATEYIGQTCTLQEFLADTTCGGTRTTFANWGTYVTQVTP